jgi:hypothetical protein
LLFRTERHCYRLSLNRLPLTIDRHLAELGILHRHIPAYSEHTIVYWQSNLLHLISPLARAWINDAPTRFTHRWDRSQAQYTASSMHMIRNISSRKATIASLQLPDKTTVAAHNPHIILTVLGSTSVRCLDLEENRHLADSDLVQSHRIRPLMAAKHKISPLPRYRSTKNYNIVPEP